MVAMTAPNTKTTTRNASAATATDATRGMTIYCLARFAKEGKHHDAHINTSRSAGSFGWYAPINSDVGKRELLRILDTQRNTQMTDQITVPRETWDALREALLGLLLSHAMPSSVCKERPAHDAAYAALTAANAVSAEPQVQAKVSWNLKYADSTPKLNVGNSAFEDWFQQQPFATQIGVKQMCRDAYAAGMGDPLVTYAHPQATEPTWMPIETAPKDGSEILLGHPDGSLTVGWWRARNPSQGWTDGDSYAMGWPTHWQPAPIAPEAKQ